MVVRGVLLFSLFFFVAYGEEALINQTMTTKEREAIGIDRLNPQQRKAFEIWLENWTKTVITHADSYHPSLTLTEWMTNWQEEQFKEKMTETESPDKAIHTIFRNKNGETLELADGSLWNIVPFDQFTVSMWKRGDKITITTTKYDTTRPFTLYNISKNEQAGAKRLTQASANGTRPSDPPAYFEASSSIQSIGINGSTVTLKNGITWNIAPLDQARVLNNWKILDRIRISKSNNTLYPAKLNNLDSGDDATGIEGK